MTDPKNIVDSFTFGDEITLTNISQCVRHDKHIFKSIPRLSNMKHFAIQKWNGVLKVNRNYEL